MESKQKKFIIGVLVAALVCLVIVGLFSSRTTSPYDGMNIEDYMKIADYENVDVTPAEITVTDKEVEEEIDARLEAEKTVSDATTGIVKKGDKVNIDYVGSVDGVKFDGGEEKGRDLTIGSGEFIEGFEEGLIGAEVGTTKNIKVKFPDDYFNSDLAGKNALFAVKINSKEVAVIPSLDEKFVKEHSDVETVAEYKKLVRSEVKKEKEEMSDMNKMSEMWTELVNDSKIKKDDSGKELYPEERLEQIITETKTFYEEIANNNNLSVEDYAKQMFGMDQETFEKQIEEYAKMTVKDEMLTYYIAEKEGIEISKKEYNQYITDLLAQYGYTEESFEEANNGKSYEEVEGKDKVMAAALRQKVQKTLLEKGYENHEKAEKEKAAKEKAENEKKSENKKNNSSKNNNKDK